MDNYKDLEEANKEVERSKVVLRQVEDEDTKKDKQEKKTTEDKNAEVEGSGIFTTDGEELPKIDGGYDIIDPGGSLGDDDLVSV